MHDLICLFHSKYKQGHHLVMYFYDSFIAEAVILCRGTHQSVTVINSIFSCINSNFKALIEDLRITEVVNNLKLELVAGL